jgi:hypothetical protein
MPVLSFKRPPADQAHGLRQLFHAGHRLLLPVVHPGQLNSAGVLLERLCTAFTDAGHQVLLVDAGPSAPLPGEWASVDLASSVEPLADRLHYLAARSLPMHFLDPRGSTAPFVEAALEAQPQAEVVILNAGPSELARMFLHADHLQHAPAVLLAEDSPGSVTDAYAAMKLLSQRAGWLVYDLMLSVTAQSPRAERISQQMSRCADDFLGAVLRQSLYVDPLCDPCEPPSHALRRWAASSMQAPWPVGAAQAPVAGRSLARAMN